MSSQDEGGEGPDDVGNGPQTQDHATRLAKKIQRPKPTLAVTGKGDNNKDNDDQRPSKRRELLMYDPERDELPAVRVRKVTTKALENTKQKKPNVGNSGSPVKGKKRAFEEEDTGGQPATKKVKVSKKPALKVKTKQSGRATGKK
jgi:hypothetical protein